MARSNVFAIDLDATLRAVSEANADLAASNSELAKALRAKTEFLATTSHEIRTPLNGILGMTQVILAGESLDPALRDRIKLVHGAGETMRALVDDILDVAKMETGALARIEERFKAEALTHASEILSSQADAGNIDITGLRKLVPPTTAQVASAVRAAVDRLPVTLRSTPRPSAAVAPVSASSRSTKGRQAAISPGVGARSPPFAFSGRHLTSGVT